MTSAAEDLRDEAERCVLGACLISEQAIHDSAQVITSTDFYRPHHGTIFAVIVSMWAAGQPVDMITVTSALLDTGDISRVGGAPYLHRLVSEVPTAASAGHYARIVAEQSMTRRLDVLGIKLQQAASMDLDQRTAIIQSTLGDLTAIASGRSSVDPVDSLLASVLDTAGLNTLADPEYLVDGVLYRDTIAWLAGRPGRGKTLVALDIAGSVGTGTQWQGYRVSAGRVLYVIAEGARGVRRRVRAWEHLARRPMTGVDFLPHPVQAGDERAWSTLCRAAARQKYSMIVLDTQARVTVGLDENSGTDMGLYVERVEQLRVSSGACVLSLHHTPRNGDHVRGHTAIEGAAQTIIMVVKSGNILTLHNTEDKGGKQKDAEPFDAISLEIKAVGDENGSVALAYTDKPEPSAEISAARCQTMLRTWWTKHRDDELSVTTLAESGISKDTFYTYKYALRDSGLMEILGKEGKGNRVRYRLTKDPESDE